MSLLIAVPVYAQPQQAFSESMEYLEAVLQESKFDYDVLYITGESLVQRARNNAVTSFLASRFERLLFIDSDIEFSPESVQKLWNLDEDVCCASYPMRMMRSLKDHENYREVQELLGSLAEKLVYPIPATCWKDGEMVEINDLEGPTEVEFGPTGFMMVKRRVFEEMTKYFPERKHMTNRHGGDFKSRRESFSWFDPRVTTEENWQDRIYLSEDYAFSEDYRQMGGKIILEPSIRLKHYGTYGFGE